MKLFPYDYGYVSSTPRLPQQLLVQNLHKTQISDSVNSDVAMASLKHWDLLEECLALQAACEDGDAIFALETDVRTKQKELRTIVMVYELEEKLFQGVNMDIGPDATSNAANNRDVGKENAVEEIMRLEFTNAARDAICEADTLIRNAMFSASDVNAVLALTKAKAQIRYKKHVHEDMDKENVTKTPRTMQTDLRTCEKAIAKQRRG